MLDVSASKTVYGCINAHARLQVKSPVYHSTMQFSGNVMHLCEVSFCFCLTICAQTALRKRLISYGLLHNASLVNNVPLLIRERRLIEQISAGWDGKPCQTPETSPNGREINMMQCIPDIGVSCVLHQRSVFRTLPGCNQSTQPNRDGPSTVQKVCIHFVCKTVFQCLHKSHFKTNSSDSK